MIKLNVWLAVEPGRDLLAGELVVADPDGQGRLLGQFRYVPDYLDHPEATPLDPIHLPLSPVNFDANRPAAGVHGVFEDSLPDDWGRRILARRYRLGRNEQRVPHLLARLGGQGMGGLSYGAGDVAPPKPKGVEGRFLEDLQQQARTFEENATSADEEMALLFQAGSSPGGARPKALVNDHGRACLAKFASLKDRFDVVALEAATMELARRAGVNAAPSRLVSCGSKRILLVERFDLDADSGRRCHMISLQTLLSAEGYYTAGYADIAGVIRRVANDPARDLIRLFRQLLFNVMAGNTDDHLKNFCMLFDGREWSLSPAFDLVPNIGLNHEHVLRIGLYPQVDSRRILVEEARHFGIKRRSKADDIIDAVFSAVADWERVFAEFGVPKRDIEIIGRDIENRLVRLRR